MILLDTNVLSEPLKPTPEPAVLTWLDSQPLETLFLSAITLAELQYGIAALPAGQRKDGLRSAFNSRILTLFGATDGYIAAIAAAHGCAVATRDVSPFQAAGLRVLNPWVDG